MVKKEIFILIQARITSKRFPNKILEKIGNKIVLDLIYKRLSNIKQKKKIFFIIPNNKKNQELKRFLVKRNYKFFTGSENNVLKRYFLAAKTLKAVHIMRVTSDCPLIEPNLLNLMIKKYLKSNYDLVSNFFPKKSYPDGFDAEIFNYKALAYAFKNAKTKYEKEHVTPFIQKNGKFRIFNVINKIDYSKLRVTLDYKRDLKKLNEIYKRLNFNENLSFFDIIKLYKKKPEIF